VSEDFGANWKNIGNSLPSEPINVIKEDPQNENVLYVGTDHGLYISLDKGATFQRFSAKLPSVAVHDVAVHPTESDLIIGTHGRSLYIANVKEIQASNEAILKSGIHIFDVNKIKARNWGNHVQIFEKPDTISLAIPVFAGQSGKAKFQVKSEKGLLLHSFESELAAGFNYPEYHLIFNENVKEAYETELNINAKEKDKEIPRKIKLKKAEDGNWYLKAGKYSVLIEFNGEKAEGKFEIE
ncbi:MAG: VPS10 domain-containing protein, partial [Saprospiraceae bacterium]